MHAQMESLQIMQSRGVIANNMDISDEENEFDQTQEEGEEAKYPREKMIKYLKELRGKPKMEVATYSKSWDLEESIDWIEDIEKLFDMAKI